MVSLFSESKILKFKDVYRFRICEFFYVNDLKGSFTRTHSHNTRYVENLLPNFQRLSSTFRSINYIGPSLWNDIPNFIREINSKGNFKYTLRNYILASYGDDL